MSFLLIEQQPEPVQRPDVPHLRTMEGGQLQELGIHNEWRILRHGVQDLSDLLVHLEPIIPFYADDTIM